MTKLRLPAVLLIALFVAACGPSTLPNDAAANPCANDPNFNGDFCPQVVAIATARLGWLHGPITSTTYRESMCPPNARCLAMIHGIESWVIFTFAFGDPVMIHVGPPETGGAGLVARDPEPVPEWVIDEIQGIAGQGA